MAQSAPATAQTIEAYVGETMDAARMGPVHWQVLALVASGYFFDVLDFTIFGALVPDLIKSGFVTQAQVPWIGSVTVAGLFVGTLGQGEFTDRFGRKAVYQFNLLLFGLATIIAALPPIPSIGFDPGLGWLLSLIAKSVDYVPAVNEDLARVVDPGEEVRFAPDSPLEGSCFVVEAGPQKIGFAIDSALEGAGFEPSVPRINAHFPKCRHRPDPAAWSGDLARNR
jgi:hypothetical protein